MSEGELPGILLARIDPGCDPPDVPLQRVGQAD